MHKDTLFARVSQGRLVVATEGVAFHAVFGAPFVGHARADFP